MKEIMKPRYRVYRRQGSVFYLFDRHTGKRESLETADEAAARQPSDCSTRKTRRSSNR